VTASTLVSSPAISRRWDPTSEGDERGNFKTAFFWTPSLFFGQTGQPRRLSATSIVFFWTVKSRCVAGNLCGTSANVLRWTCAFFGQLLMAVSWRDLRLNGIKSVPPCGRLLRNRKAWFFGVPRKRTGSAAPAACTGSKVQVPLYPLRAQAGLSGFFAVEHRAGKRRPQPMSSYRGRCPA
jgi:hypothetical protein